MIRCALAETFRPLTSMPRVRRLSISSVRTFGSITTLLPITHVLPGYRIPLGMRWNFHVSPSRTIVWPALLPPWKRMTMSARSASRSTTLPFPSSPHWAPTMTSPGMARASAGAWPSALGALRHAQVLAPHRQRLLADLAQAGHGARADLAAQPRDGVEVGHAVDAGQLSRHPLEALDDAAQGLVVVARSVTAAGFAQLLGALAQELDRR